MPYRFDIPAVLAPRPGAGFRPGARARLYGMFVRVYAGMIRLGTAPGPAGTVRLRAE